MALPRYPIGSLDDYLEKICEQIQLSETQFETAVDRYEAVGEWLTQPGSLLQKFLPEILPQGSMLQRTTIRPMRRGEEVLPFDLDSVCRCDIDPFRTSSKSLCEDVTTRLHEHKTYAELMRNAEKEYPANGKCVRLAFLSDDFYLDVVPACKDPSDDDGIRLLIADVENWKERVGARQTWRRTDPFRIADWLQSKCVVRRLQERVMAHVAPIPARETADMKAPLRRVIQLLKRQRDVDFLGDDCRPSSIMLTTLAGRHYQGEESIADGLETVLDGIADLIADAGRSRIVVANPADEIAPHEDGIEDFVKPLTRGAYDKFISMIEHMKEMYESARDAKTKELYPMLAHSLGENVVKRAFAAAQDEVRIANSSGRLGVSSASPSIHILSEPKFQGGARPIRSNTFHLDV